QTELAVLELQGGYPRGHLTRYTALYTSLSTTYDANSENGTSVMLPFPADADFAIRPGQSIDTVTFHGDPGVQLADYNVSSNSTSLLHTEQMVDLGGGIDLAVAGSEGLDADSPGASVTNQTNHSLKNAAVIRRISDTEVQSAWIGDLPPGRKATVSFQSTSD